jgi:hypothetical protein
MQDKLMATMKENPAACSCHDWLPFSPLFVSQQLSAWWNCFWGQNKNKGIKKKNKVTNTKIKEKNKAWQ